MMKIKNFYKLFHIGLLILLLLAIVLLFNSKDVNAGFFSDYGKTDLTNDWYITESHEEIELPYDINTPKGEYISISRILDTDTYNNDVLCFRTDHTYVRVYADDKLIYSFGNKDDIPFGNSPGSIWNIIPIENLKAGTEITVSTMCPYDMYSGNFRIFMQGSKADIILYIFKTSVPLLIMTIIPFIVALFMFLINIILKKHVNTSVFREVGICFLLLTLWGFTETHGWQFFLDNAYAVQSINFVSFSMVVTSVIVCFRQMNFIENEKHFRICLTVDIIIPILLLLLQLFEIVDYFDTLTVIHVMDLVNLLLFTTDFVLSLFKKKKNLSTIILSLVMYVSIFLAFVLDILDFYLWDKFGNGFFTRFELIVIMLVAGIVAVQKAFTLYCENIEKATYEKMAYTDDMTGMNNRRAYERDVALLENAKKNLAVLYVDMNGLKSINDNLGHQKGDEAIKLVADNLLSFTDEKTACYRLGGDEFCVISSNMDAETFEEKCRKINIDLKSAGDDFIDSISIAYGAENYKTENNISICEIMKKADKKMYDMKSIMKKELLSSV